jgi:putative mRNA 3-end processing factor
VWVTHGYREQVVRYLTERGLDARAIASHWEGENDETPAVADETAIA